MNDKWLNRYFDLAWHVADWSKDPHTKVGAVLVGADRRDMAFGYNGFPPGIVDTKERLENRELKRIFTQHAERNCIDNARFDTHGATLVVTMFPCSECAKSVITKGITCVVCPPPVNREPWASDARHSELLLSEANVDMILLKK